MTDDLPISTALSETETTAVTNTTSEVVDIFASEQIFILNTPAYTSHHPRASEYEWRFSQLSDDVARIAARIENGSIDPATLTELKDRLDQLADAGAKLSAPVMLPAAEDMAVRLVSAGALDRLDEYHSDDTLYLTLFGLFAGGGIGIIVNTITQPREPTPPPLDPLYWIVLTLLAVISIVFFSQSMKIRKRANHLKHSTLASSIQGVASEAVLRKTTTGEA